MSKKVIKRKRSQRQQKPLPIAMIGGILLLIGAGLLILLRQPAGEPVTVNGRPSLAISQEQIDLGDVQVNRMVKASFTLSNTGDEPLIISHSPVAEVLEGC